MFKFFCFLVFSFIKQFRTIYLLNFSDDNDVLRMLFQNIALVECRVLKQKHTMNYRFVVSCCCFLDALSLNKFFKCVSIVAIPSWAGDESSFDKFAQSYFSNSYSFSIEQSKNFCPRKNRKGNFDLDKAFDDRRYRLKSKQHRARVMHINMSVII